MRINQIFLATDGRVRPSWRALLFVVLDVALLIAAGVVLRATLGQWLAAGPERNLLVSGLVGLASALAVSVVLVRWLDRRSFRQLGLWRYEGWGREFSLGLGLGVALISLVAALLVLLGGEVQWQTGAMTLTEALAGLGWYCLLILPAAAHEEVVFRGYPFQRLVQGWGPTVAVAALAGLFGLLHLGNPNPTALSTANTMLAGVLLAVAYLKTRGLWLPIGLHFAWNFWMGPVLGFAVSGIELKARLLEARGGDPVWLTGGSYGPEGSIVTTVVVAAAALGLARTKRLGVSSALARELE